MMKVSTQFVAEGKVDILMAIFNILGKSIAFHDDLKKYYDILQLYITENKKCETLIDAKTKTVSDPQEIISYLEQEIGVFIDGIIAELAEYGNYNIINEDFIETNTGYLDILQCGIDYYEFVGECKDNYSEQAQTEIRYARERADRHISNLNFAILSNSINEQAVYSVRNEADVRKQIQRAQTRYANESQGILASAQAKLNQEIDKYFHGKFVDDLHEAVNLFFEELLNKYIFELQNCGQIDLQCAEEIDFERSQAMLKNLTVVAKKKEVIIQAIALCPYNEDIYIKAFENDCFDSSVAAVIKYFSLEERVLNKIMELPFYQKLDYEYRKNHHIAEILPDLGAFATVQALLMDQTPQEAMYTNIESDVSSRYAQLREKISLYRDIEKFSGYAFEHFPGINSDNYQTFVYDEIEKIWNQEDSKKLLEECAKDFYCEASLWFGQPIVKYDDLLSAYCDLISNNIPEIIRNIQKKKEDAKAFEEKQELARIARGNEVLLAARNTLMKYAAAVAVNIFVTIALLVLAFNAFSLKISTTVNSYVRDKLDEYVEYYEKDFNVKYTYYQNIVPGNGNCYTVVPKITIYIKKNVNSSEDIERDISWGLSFLNDVNEGVSSFLGKYLEFQPIVTFVDKNSLEKEHRAGHYDTYTNPKYYRKTGAPQCYPLIVGIILWGVVSTRILYKKRLRPWIDNRKKLLDEYEM